MTIQPVCGLPLTIGQVFQFGDQKPWTDRHGRPFTQGDHLIKFITQDWRFIQNERIILGSFNNYNNQWFFEGEEGPNNDYEREAHRIAAEFVEDIKKGRYVAQSASVGKFADVRITFTENLELQSFSSSGNQDDLWFFRNNIDDVIYLVLSDTGLGPKTG